MFLVAVIIEQPDKWKAWVVGRDSREMLKKEHQTILFILKMSFVIAKVNLRWKDQVLSRRISLPNNLKM